jgi:LacI family transcriptional regulator
MKCSIQDIARELNISRNTVSKALNGRPGVSSKMRQLICEKANEMNYRSFLSEHEAAQKAASRGSILLLTKASVHSEFWLSVMKGLEPVLEAGGYKLQLGVMSDDDMRSLQFPAQLKDPDVRGVILVEICNIQVVRKVLEFGLPAVTVDAPRGFEDLSDVIDIVIMENKRSIHALVRKLVEQGARRFSFAGDLKSDNVGAGFQERFDAVDEALRENGLKLDMDCSFIGETNQQFMNFSYLVSRLEEMPSLPEVYFCGNDWTAIQLMHAIRYCGYSIPDDVAVIGFDNIKESANTIPALTTIDTPKEYLGAAAANCLVERIANPVKPYAFIRYATKLVSRGSA